MIITLSVFILLQLLIGPLYVWLVLFSCLGGSS